MQIGDKFTTEIIDFAYFKESGVARVNEFAVFVPWTLPGDVIEARMVKRKASFGLAELVRIKEPSPNRIAPLCPLFQKCGGCTLQNLSYKQQILLKENFLKESMKRIADMDLSSVDILPTVESPEIWYYRNKMEFVFGEQDGNFILGLHKRGSYKQYVDVKECLIFSKSASEIMERVRNFVTETGLSIYSPITHRGFLRHLVMREAKSTGKMLINLVTDYGELDIENLISLVPEYVSAFLWTINTKRADAVIPDKIRLIKGTSNIVEQIGDLNFYITPYSFIQPNPYSAALLYEKTRELANIQGDETLLDLYCGSGGIGLSLSKYAKQVFGIDSSESSIESAEMNLRLNKFSNIRFITGDVRRVLYQRKGWRGRIDIAIIDPPRDGMPGRAIMHLINLKIPELIYVSCNPSTFARDAALLTKNRYSLKSIQLIDMFPHTYHIELIAKFTLSQNMR
ncbi:23S rRNA (uracil(1939)-C(5))-methyltransferase RlmD [candidate division WOR-3 bacterium]|nr:23S rRNA (uracil(1939)-C(5))-methyltransferase RlmD [candidate division WOR-3 bacterium]